MFQTFTGSSRRPRQVNLSGRNNNPFAAVQASPSAHSSQSSAVQHAQQERKARQQDRERLQASKIIQRSWRAHVARQRLHQVQREKWDNLIDGETTDIHRLLALLLKFARPYRDSSDVTRVIRTCQLLLDQERSEQLLGIDVQVAFADVLLDTIDAIHKLHDTEAEILLLSTLQAICQQNAEQLASRSVRLVTTVSTILTRDNSPALSNLIYDLVSTFLQRAGSRSVLAHQGIIKILGIPSSQNGLDLERIAPSVNPGSLTLAMQEQLKTTTSAKHEDSTLQLAQYIYLHRIATSSGKDVLKFGASSTRNSQGDEIIAHIGALTQLISNSARSQLNAEEETSGNGLQPFLKQQLDSLVDKETICSILAQLEISGVDGQQSDYASTLASYILTLIQQFPQRSDDIRMWIYLSSATIITNGITQQLPAIKFFWQAVKSTSIFRDISRDSKTAIKLLNAQSRQSLSQTKQKALDRDWQLCLLFLELYMFVLRIMDDDEFLSGDADSAVRNTQRRQSALLIPEVKDLIVFLKHLAYTMYWHATEVTTEERYYLSAGLSSYFSGTEPADPELNRASNPDPLIISGVQSSSLSYVKGVVTGLLRSLYERDSRLGFAPAGFWLMPQLNMSGFEVAVVQEQRNKYDHAEDESGGEEGMDMEEDDHEDRDLQTLVGATRTQHLRRLEQIRKQQAKVTKKRKLAETFPRLNIMENTPFFIPFNARVRIFREFVRQDKLVRRMGVLDADNWRIQVMNNGTTAELLHRSARVRRNHVMEDAYDQLYKIGNNLKEPISITFVDQFDTVEAGIDGGGVTKEFLTSISEEAFKKGELLLFKENSQHLLYPNPVRLEQEKRMMRDDGVSANDLEWNQHIRELLRRYEFVGRIVGKCLYEGILLDVHFAPFFLVKWASRGGPGSAANESHYRASINDVRALDEELYKGLLDLKNNTGDAEDFALDFTIVDEISTEDEPLGSIMHTTELRPDGANIPVTNENKLVYIAAVARHRLQKQSRLQDRAFLQGLGDMIDPTWLSMFNQSELQTLIGGDQSELDVDDLRRNTVYSGVYEIGDDGEEHPTVKLFWKVVRELSDQDRRSLLKYVTSTPRAPLLGFSQLRPAFTIRDSGQDQQRLPSTSTCVNLLKLPQYHTKEILREKLVYAISSGAGFDLS